MIFSLNKSQFSINSVFFVNFHIFLTGLHFLQSSRAINPPPHLLPTSSRGIFQHDFRRGGVDFFWNNPIQGNKISESYWEINNKAIFSQVRLIHL